MKRITKCVGCGNVVGVYKSYKCHVREHVKNTLTGEMKVAEYEGKLCGRCNKLAGYKTRKELLKEVK